MGASLQLVSMETGSPTQLPRTVSLQLDSDRGRCGRGILELQLLAAGSQTTGSAAVSPPSMCTAVAQVPTRTGELTQGQAQTRLQTLQRNPPLAEGSLFFWTTADTGYCQSFPFLLNWWVKTGRLFWIARLYSWWRQKTFFIWILITCISFVWTAWINPWAVFLLGLPAFYRSEILSSLDFNLLSDI